MNSLYNFSRFERSWDVSRDGYSSAPLPRSEQSAEQYKLAKMIRVMVGQQQGLTQGSLASAVRKRSEKVCLCISNQLRHRRKIVFEGLDTFVPSGSAGRRRCFRSVSR